MHGDRVRTGAAGPEGSQPSPPADVPAEPGAERGRSRFLARTTSRLMQLRSCRSGTIARCVVAP